MMGKELYRIFSRRITLLALAAATAFLIYYGFFHIWEEAVIEDGNLLRHGEAVARDKEIAEEFAGPLTEETVRAIWEKYGAPVNYMDPVVREEDLQRLAEQGGYDNYCNTVVTRLFAGKVMQEDGSAVFLLPEEISESRYLDGNHIFGYVGLGWSWYWDQFLVMILLVSVVVIIALAPMFSEDYAFRTADIVLPTVRGRIRIWQTRVGAGFFFASAYYWLMGAFIFLLNLLFYGADGLNISCGFTYLPYDLMRDSDPLWKAVLIMHLGGWFSMLALTLQIQAVSSKNKSTFGALLWSLAAFLGPIAIINLILKNLPFMGVNKWLQYFCYSMPFSFSGMYLQAPPSGKQILLTFALITAVLSCALGGLCWCRHQVRN